MTTAAQILLITPAERSRAQKALKKAISDARRSSLLERPGAPRWDDPGWNIDSLTDRSAPGKSAVIRIGPILPRGQRSRTVVETYDSYWGDLLKVLLLSRLEESEAEAARLKNTTMIAFAQAVRALIDHVIATGAADITAVSKVDVEPFLEQMTSKNNFTYGKTAIEMLVARNIAPQLSGFFAKIHRQAGRGMPSSVQPTSWNEIVALADAYNRLKLETSLLACREDFHYLRYNTMLATLLACAPGRIAELWRLAADTAVITAPLENLGDQIPAEQADTLDFKFALVWHPLKKGRAVIKPVPGAMQPVAKSCVDILRSYGEEPRATARWIMDNPGVIPIAKEIADLRKCRETGTISTQQIKSLLGVSNGARLSDIPLWKNFRKTRETVRRSGKGSVGVYHYSFNELQKEWWELFQVKWKKAFGADWPYSIDTETFRLKADNTFLLTYEGEFNTRYKHSQKIFLATPSIASLQNLLSDHGDLGSIFRRLDIRLPDGSFPSIQTHDLRHFLNTMAQRAGIPEPIIALWSGRASIAQNATYDHRTDAERLRAHAYHVSDYDEAQAEDLLARQVGQTFSGMIALPSVQVLSSSEETVKELTRRLMISITQFGFCVGDLKSDPCPHAMNCLSCARLVVCKGATKAKSRVEDKIKRLEGQYRIIRDHVEKDGGKRIRNGKILAHLQSQIDGAKDLLTALNDPNIPDGSILARSDKEGATTASFSDRVTLFAAQQRELQNGRRPITDG